MSVERRHKCIVCGRPFPEGQGIVLRISGEVLEFHSSKCFSKFARDLLTRLPEEEVKGYIKKLREEYIELLEQKQKLRSKRIA
jgi:ribosomal protein L24E